MKTPLPNPEQPDLLRQRDALRGACRHALTILDGMNRTPDLNAEIQRSGFANDFAACFEALENCEKI